MKASSKGSERSKKKPKESIVRKQVNQVTQLLSSFLDNSQMKPIYKARSEINKLYDPNLKKLVIPSNEIFNKAIQDNSNTVWKNPERVIAELSKPSGLPIVSSLGPFTLT